MVGTIAHICNRGVEKRTLFTEERDYVRFVHNLFRFNHDGPSLSYCTATERDVLKQPPLVDILKWSALPNHYHLLLHERAVGGILKFVQRLGNGYTKYFNIKNERSGYLFQSAAQINTISKHRQFLYIPLYVELNPLDLFDKDWRKSQARNAEQSLQFLKNYRWSSYRDYAGVNNFPPIINKNLFYELYETNEKSCQKEIRNWLNKPQAARYNGISSMM